MPRARVVPLAVLLLLYAATALPWLIVVPPFEASDETAHYDHARYIAFTGHLPDRVPTQLNDEGWYTSHWPQPPLYYLLQAAVIQATGAEAVSPLSLIAFDPAERPLGTTTRRLIVQEGGERRATRALLIGRLVSWTCGAGLIAALFAALGAAGFSERTRVLLIASLLLVPGFGGNVTAVNNDALAALLGAAGTIVLLRLAAHPGRDDDDRRAAGAGRAGPRLLAWAAAGALIGLAMLSKPTTIALLPMAVACALVAANPSWRAVTARLGALAAGYAVCWSGMWIRNWIVFGDPAASALTSILRRFHGAPHGWTLWEPDLYAGMTHELFRGFFAQFGWSGVGPQAEPIWWWYRLIALAAVTLWAIAIVRVAVQGRDTPMAVGQARIAAVGVVSHIAILFAINSVMWASSGRHLLPALAPMIVLVAFGGRVISRALSSDGLTSAARMAAAAAVWLLAAAWISVLVELTRGYRFGG